MSFVHLCAVNHNVRLKRLRESVGFTQLQFAQALGLRRAGTISRWETTATMPQSGQIHALAEATGRTPAEVRSWLETGEPELRWVGRPKPEPPRAVPQPAQPGPEDGSDEVERAYAWWHWLQLTSDERREIRGRYVRIKGSGEERTATPREMGRPKAWDPNAGRTGGG